MNSSKSEPVKPKIAVIHPGPSVFVKNNIISLCENELLEKFYTTYVHHPDYFLSKLIDAIGSLNGNIKKEFSRRSFNEIPFEYIHTYPYAELLRVFVNRIIKSPVLTHKIWEKSEPLFSKNASDSIGDCAAAVYTYEGNAYDVLKKAKSKNQFSWYEMVSQHELYFHDLLAEQIKKYPQLNTPYYSNLLENGNSEYAKRKNAELELADRIICNSNFTRETIRYAGLATDKVKVIPLGSPAPVKKIKNRPDKMKFVYAGNQSVRKGIHILIEAWKNSGIKQHEAELFLVGSRDLPDDFYVNLPENVKVINNIPHQELIELFRETSMFVLPTLADGFGMVITEAMSQGVPVLATYNCAGPDLITHGVNGLLIKAGSTEMLIEQLKWAVSHPSEVEQMGMRALEKASQWQWSDYRKAWLEIILTDLENAGH